MFPEEAERTAIATAKKAGTALLRHYGSKLAIEAKSDEPLNIVTNADREADRIIRHMLLKRFPEHGIISEESAEKKGVYQWHVDPIDGTINYSRGRSDFCISIGLAKGKELLAGLVYAPARNDLFTAIEGKGAYHNGKRMSVAAQENIADAVIGFDWAYTQWSRTTILRIMRLMKDCGTARIAGSSALGLCDVAAGLQDAYVDVESYSWDYAAGVLIAREAGAKVSTWKNTPWKLQHKTSAIAAHPTLHRQLMERLE